MNKKLFERILDLSGQAILEDFVRTQKGTKIKRDSTFKIGKTIGPFVYINYYYQHILPENFKKARGILLKAKKDFNYDVIKYNKKTGETSFISSPDFDTADEPIIGDSYKVTPEGEITFRKQSADPEIYHHKWLMVTDTYPGFDVAESMERSKEWLRIPNIDFSRIGRKSYWEKNILPKL